MQQLVAQAREAGIDLVGPERLLTGLTKPVPESALAAELTERVGYQAGDRAGKSGTNERNGARAKTVLTQIGPVQVDVPRDREGTFDPVIARKRQRRLDGIEELVLSLTARSLTTGEISAGPRPMTSRTYSPLQQDTDRETPALPQRTQMPRGDDRVSIHDVAEGERLRWRTSSVSGAP